MDQGLIFSSKSQRAFDIGSRSWVTAPDRAQRSDSVKQHFILQPPLFLFSFSPHIVGLHKGSRALLGGVCPILFNKSARGLYGIYLIRRSGMQYRWVLLRVVPFGNKIQTKSVITKQYYTPKILISYFIILPLFSAKWFPSFLIRRESKTDREV